MTPLLQNHPFCRFAEQVRMQVGDVLRALKQNHELNSNLLLFCYWFAASNQGVLSKVSMKRLSAAIYAWHQKIVSPLETLRTQLAEPAATTLCTMEDALDDSLTNTLLIAEQVEQFLMAEAMPKKAQRGRAFLAQSTTHTCLNIATYCQMMYVPLNETDYALLAQILLIVFPEMDATKALSLVRDTILGRQAKMPLQRALPLSMPE